MKSNNLVIIAGPAASGKTILKTKLLHDFHAYPLRPSDAYIILAQQLGIPKEQAFSSIKRDEAEVFFCNQCKKHPWVIGDQHLAIQFKKDSHMAVSGDSTQDIEEEYSSAISTELFMRLQKERINVLVIFLTANPKVLLMRAQNRFREMGQAIRNHSEEEVYREVEAEKSFFNELIEATRVDHCVIDTSDKTDQEVYLSALREIESFSSTSKVIRASPLRLIEGIVHIGAIEINAVRQCNLSCKACSHSAPLSKQRTMDVAQLSSDLHFLSRFLHCHTVRILGGEPTLHPQFTDLIIAVNQSRIADKICLVTNGLLLHTFDKGAFSLINKIEISLYPLSRTVVQRIRTTAKALSDNNVEVTLLEYPAFRESISQEPCLNKELTKTVFETCQIAHVWRCVTIDNGRIFRCPQSMIYCENENNYEDAIDIYGINDSSRLLSFLVNPVPLKSCEKCLGSVGRLLKHQQINRDGWKNELPERPENAIDYLYLRKLKADAAVWNGCSHRELIE